MEHGERRAMYRKLDELVAEATSASCSKLDDFHRLAAWKRIQKLDPPHRAAILPAAWRQFGEARDYSTESLAADALLEDSMKFASSLDASEIPHLLRALAEFPVASLARLPDLSFVIRMFAEAGKLNQECLSIIPTIVQFFTNRSTPANAELLRECAAQLEMARKVAVSLTPPEAYSHTSPDLRSVWMELIELCQKQKGSKPTASLLRAAKPLVDQLPDFLESSGRYFDQFGGFEVTGSWGLSSSSSLPTLWTPEAARGIVWLGATRSPDSSWCQAVAMLCLTGLKPTGTGSLRSISLANACVQGLGTAGIPNGLTQLLILSTKVKQKPVQKAIERAIQAIADRSGVSPDEVAEIGLPTFGFGADGRRAERFEEASAELQIDADGVQIAWTSRGKAVKSVPATVRELHADRLQELRSEVKEVNRLILAVRQRLDGLLLRQPTWSLTDFRRRYLEHPLVASLAKRLVWRIDSCPVRFDTLGHPHDQAGSPIVVAGDDPRVSVWHPIDAGPQETLQWRQALEDAGVAQPFKQVHREVYLLTEAERTTDTYSNRFAAHIIRQSQFRSLAGLRGWTVPLLGAWDGGDQSVARKQLPNQQLCAEFWVNAIEDAGNNSPMLDSGGWVHLSTDQVRFTRANENGPIPLDQIPPLVFSEVMRDVDLFVGVASVGNDPNWQDGGPGGRFREYWQTYAFGDLGESAKTRRAVLERMLPRLTKLAGKWTLVDRFLVIRGSIRTYKIHLGSGNILMEPNDQYLCIVPDQSKRSAATDVRLPFEGDSVLSIILSKAFMLAEDTKIADRSIVSQIERA